MKYKSLKIIFLIVALVTIQANAQTKIVQMMEGEIRAGLTTPLGGYHTGKAQISAALGIEGRYKINPFAGAALGFAFNDVVGDKYFPGKGTSMLFAPRIGIEFLYHIRLMAQFNICRKGYNNFSLTLGFILGGRPKKQ